MCSLLGTSRYLQAAGAQGVLPGVFGLISKRFRTPVFALFYMVKYGSFSFRSLRNITFLYLFIGFIDSLINLYVHSDSSGYQS